MSYRVPVIGETWRSRGAPANIAVEILNVDDLTREVTFQATVRVGRHTHQSTRTVTLDGFVQNYEITPDLPAGQGDEGAADPADGGALTLDTGGAS